MVQKHCSVSNHPTLNEIFFALSMFALIEGMVGALIIAPGMLDISSTALNLFLPPLVVVCRNDFFLGASPVSLCAMGMEWDEMGLAFSI